MAANCAPDPRFPHPDRRYPCAWNAVAAIYLEYPNSFLEHSVGMSEDAAPQPDSDAYDAASISVLKGLDAVRTPTRHVYRRHR